jgi:anti-sigma regulatory factor (Ser/Thr protein kinase)
MHTSFSITPIPTAPRDARHAFADAVAELPTLLAADVLLVTSELVTNVILYTSSGVGDATLTVDLAAVHLDVSDHDPQPVDLQHAPEPGANTGRGLAITRALASLVTQTVRDNGKTITAVFARPDMYEPGY